MSVRGTIDTQIKEEPTGNFNSRNSYKSNTLSPQMKRGLPTSFLKNKSKQLSIMKYISNKKKLEQINLENKKIHQRLSLISKKNTQISKIGQAKDDYRELSISKRRASDYIYKNFTSRSKQSQNYEDATPNKRNSSIPLDLESNTMSASVNGKIDDEGPKSMLDRTEIKKAGPGITKASNGDIQIDLATMSSNLPPLKQNKSSQQLHPLSHRSSSSIGQKSKQNSYLVSEFVISQN